MDRQQDKNTPCLNPQETEAHAETAQAAAPTNTSAAQTEGAAHESAAEQGSTEAPSALGSAAEQGSTEAPSALNSAAEQADTAPQDTLCAAAPEAGAAAPRAPAQNAAADSAATQSVTAPVMGVGQSTAPYSAPAFSGQQPAPHAQAGAASASPFAYGAQPVYGAPAPAGTPPYTAQGVYSAQHPIYGAAPHAPQQPYVAQQQPYAPQGTYLPPQSWQSAPYAPPAQAYPYGAPQAPRAQVYPYGAQQAPLPPYGYGAPQPYYNAPAYGGPRASGSAQPSVYGQAGSGGAGRKKGGWRTPVIVVSVCLLLASSAIAMGAWWREAQKPQPIDPANLPNFAINELPENLDDGLSAAEIAKKVNSSVVSIEAKVIGEWEPIGIASGIVLSADGYIITNEHVVENTDYPEITGLIVTLDDGRSFDATVVGMDTRTDLAVLKVVATDLAAAEFGDSSQLQVGERVLAIGNAAGEYSGSITQGIISGLGRELSYDDGTPTGYNLIQTDAAINPGNSGGALVNRFGQIIGINSAKIGGDVFEGMGFAIPIHEAKPIVEELMTTGFVERAALGITVEPLGILYGNIDEGMPEKGLYIRTVDPGSDLNNYDIVAGDVILSANGKEMTKTADLTQELAAHKPGDTIELEIQKGGSKKIITVEVKLIASQSK